MNKWYSLFFIISCPFACTRANAHACTRLGATAEQSNKQPFSARRGGELHCILKGFKGVHCTHFCKYATINVALSCLGC